MKLTIVRHGETLENASNTIMGHLGGELSETGIKQAKETAKRLGNESFDQIWSSDLKRCTDTAKYILELQPELNLQTTPALREVNYGKYQGKSSDSIQLFLNNLDDFITAKMPGGESHLEMFSRVIDFINELFESFSQESILLVTHTGPIEAIKSAIDRPPRDKVFSKDALNASVWHVTISKPLELYPKR